MSVLMIDVGGTNVKVMSAPGGEMRKIPSHADMSAETMVRGVKELVRDWEFDRVSIGFPGLIRNGLPARDPLNLGAGWIDFDYAGVFEKPIRFINDAAMQALGNYRSGRILFFGLGTSTGATVIADDAVLPIEIGMLRLSRKDRFVDLLSKEALKRDGIKKWLESVHEAIAMLQDVFYPDETVLGGGNAKHVDPLPHGCVQVDNRSAYRGALRLWEDADLFASPRRTSWHIHRRESPRPPELSATR